jgi:PPOX class probable F420-dependent enzyme
VAALSAKQVEVLKSGKHFGVVATIGGSGAPQTSVVWVDTDGENLLFNTTTKRAKGRNLRNDPRVSVTVWHSEDPYRYFEVEGEAELDEHGAAEHIDELSHRYEGRPFRTPFDRVIVRVRPRRVLDYGIDD